MHKQNRGFTLIEILIVVVIIGILSAIAFPSYQRYVDSSIRSAAQQFMMQIASKEEQYLMENRSYVTGEQALQRLMLDAELASNDTVNDNYTITIEQMAISANTYRIRAAGKGRMAGTPELSLNSQGQKEPADLWE